MPKPKFSDEEFIEAFEKFGPVPLSEKFDISLRNIYKRRSNIETKIGRQIKSPHPIKSRTTRHAIDKPQHIPFEITDGTVVVFSDAHFWPDIYSTMNKALLVMIQKLKPKAVIANGDMCDFAGISRHASIGWEDKPTVADEIKVCQERMGEIEKAAKGAELFWPLGNHDMRLETRVSTMLPEFAGLHGVHLKDWFPSWKPTWSVWINDDVIVKHRYKGGQHAASNNILWSGKSMVTGHLHNAQVRPHDDYNGTRWGVDTGTLADPYGPQFMNYTEAGPLNWRSAFCVLTFRNGRLMQPELVLKWQENIVQFRGELIGV